MGFNIKVGDTILVKGQKYKVTNIKIFSVKHDNKSVVHRKIYDCYDYRKKPVCILHEEIDGHIQKE